MRSVVAVVFVVFAAVTLPAAAQSQSGLGRHKPTQQPQDNKKQEEPPPPPQNGGKKDKEDEQK